MPFDLHQTFQDPAQDILQIFHKMMDKRGLTKTMITNTKNIMAETQEPFLNFESCVWVRNQP